MRQTPAPPRRTHPLEGEVLGDDFFRLRGVFTRRAGLEHGGDRHPGGVEFFTDDLLKVAADALFIGVAVVLESLVGDSFDGDASAGLSLCHDFVLDRRCVRSANVGLNVDAGEELVPSTKSHPSPCW